MFIELTDHLACPRGHAEQYLVLLPDRMDGRRVVSGDLGCPVCGQVVRIADGVADFGGGIAAVGGSALSAPAIAAFLGLSGPGGYVALAGTVTGLAGELAAALPGVGLVLLNPAAGTPDAAGASVLRASRPPLKTGSMRGAVIGADQAAREGWVADAVRAVLPGLRVVVEGAAPPERGVEVLAEMAGCWVGKKLG